MDSAALSDLPISDLPFMDAFPQPDLAQWRAAVDKVLKGGDFEKRLVSRTSDGLRIEPLYRAATPVMRPQRGASGRWSVCARVDHPEPDDARALALADLEGGADALTLAFAGTRASRRHGLVAADVEALDTALDGVALDLIRLRLEPSRAGGNQALLVADLVEHRKLAPEAVDIAFGLDPIGVLASDGDLPASWAETGAGLARTIEALRSRGFKGPFVTVDTRPYHEAGATEAQELGTAMATAIAYLRVLEAGGLPLEVARDAIGFTFVADTDAFLTIAKLRAARLLWDRVQGACGLAPAPMQLHAETAWRSLTRRDPWVNMLRAAIATFAAGVGGADSLTVLPFTAALGLPDAFARRVARNTQLVLLEEASLWRVADPAAGAGGFETLTQQLCEAGWTKMQDLEREAGGGLPGIVSALQNGHVQAGLARQRDLRAKAVATRREPLTGTSEYPNLAEAPVAVLNVADIARSKRQDGALPSVRTSEPFEALRDRADAVAAATGRRPAVFLATLGPIADFAARAGFARNLFEAGGLEAQSGLGFSTDGRTDIAALTAAFVASGAALACLCGSDAAYEVEAIEAAHALAAVGATVWLAGRPGDLETELTEAGISSFVFAGCDAVAVLTEALEAASPALPE